MAQSFSQFPCMIEHPCTRQKHLYRISAGPTRPCTRMCLRMAANLSSSAECQGCRAIAIRAACTRQAAASVHPCQRSSGLAHVCRAASSAPARAALVRAAGPPCPLRRATVRWPLCQPPASRPPRPLSHRGRIRSISAVAGAGDAAPTRPRGLACCRGRGPPRRPGRAFAAALAAP